MPTGDREIVGNTREYAGEISLECLYGTFGSIPSVHVGGCQLDSASIFVYGCLEILWRLIIKNGAEGIQHFVENSL
jgi:hypothetical protein